MTRCQNNSQVCENTQIRHHPKNSVHLSRRVESCFCCSLMGTDDLTALGSPWADSEWRLLCRHPENPFARSHEEEKTGFDQETVDFAPG